MIKLENANIGFEDHFVLENINWLIEADQHWVVVGGNGAGKSALAAVLASHGEVLNGAISGIPEKVSLVSFEAQALLIDAERKKDDADLLDIISEGTLVREMLDESGTDLEMQTKLIQAFKFGSLLEQGFRKLSSGETRKLMLIRALSSSPDLIILDEPFEGLDQESSAYLSTLLFNISNHVQIVLVQNRIDEIPSFVTHCAYMNHGKLEDVFESDDSDSMNHLHQLLHLKTTNLQIPASDKDFSAPDLDSSESLVRIRNGRIAYGDTIIFEGLDWTIESGKHWQVTGPNGSGKTCLLNLITGDHPQCYVNDILIFGIQRGTGESIWDIKQHIGYVSSALQWEYTVSVSVRNTIISGFYDSIGIYQKFTELQAEIADHWLQLLDMEGRTNQPFTHLSFGDQRLVLIARAMVKHPTLLILDEPCLGLDNLNRQRVLALIEKICEGIETTVLYVNHKSQDSIKGINHHLAMKLRE